MRRAWLLARADLRRKRGQAAVLLAFVALAAAVATIGLVVGLRYPASYDQAAAQANVPHVVIMESDSVYSPAHRDQLADRPDATAVETEPVFAAGAKTRFGDGELTMVVMIVSATQDRSMDLVDMRPGAQDLRAGGVYLPYLFEVAGGYAVGDPITLTRGEDVIELTVAGFADEAMFGSLLNQWYRLVVSPDTFAGLAEQFPDARATLVTAQFADKADAVRIATDYSSQALEDNPAAMDAVAAGQAVLRVTDWEVMRQGRVFMASILATIAMAFAAIVGVVALIMIRFRVRAQIEDSMADIGTLKALGYTSGQLAAGLVLQVGLIASVGAVAGTLLGHAALPALADALSAQSALTWRPGFDWAAGGTCAGGIVGVAAAVAGWACWRLRSLPPLTALRFGLEVHDFKRDRLPLARVRARLPFALALKAVVRSPAQSATIALVVAPAAFMATAALAAYNGIGVEQDSFYRIVGGEVPDVIAEVADPLDAPRALAELEGLPQVRKAAEYSNTVRLRLNGDLTFGLVTGDFAKFEGTLVFKGRFPAHPNEVAVSARHAELLDLAVGDEVRLAAAGTEASYLVTGLIQTMNESGLVTAATTAGLERIWPGRPWTQIGVYLRDPAEAADFAARLADGDLVGPPLLGALNLREQGQAQLQAYGAIMAGVAGVMAAVAAAVTALVLVGVLGTAIRRQRTAFGVQRALGFTTGQLARQVAATYWPAAAIGTALGCAAGWALFPALMGALFRSLGIYSLDMAAPAAAVAVLAAALAAFALAVALGLAAGVRRVTAYALVTE
ncbi:MAG: FtsX-like permease family protein [Bifidobacteriaceae bacterium]|jgi:putative ABC transport system permease protein|nr:FtsX-like permease family protein [Bifidobacteriaceae bacterium]